MPLQEVIVCATAPSSSSAGPGAISLHDIRTSTNLASFKQSNAAVHCTAIVETSNAQGGFMLASQHEKSILNVYSFQKDQITLKIVLPEKLSCIAVDAWGEFCAGGTSQGRIYLWEVTSGILYNSWDAHYRQVTVLRFTADGAAIVSGSEDSSVSVWPVSRLIDDDLQNDLPLPYCTFSDHTLPVTDIICGIGAYPNCRVITASLDHSAKLWDVSSRSLLTTFQFPQPISCLAWDTAERMFWAGSPDGSIHQMNLFHQRDDKLAGRLVKAVGGAGVSDTIRIGEDRESQKKRLISVGDAVITLATSLTSALLLVGTSGGIIHVYDIASHQPLRTISTYQGYSITYLASMLKPPDLMGHISLSLAPADAKDVIPVKTVSALQRTRDIKTREAHEVSLLLLAQNIMCEDETSYTADEFHRDHAYFVQPSALTSVPGVHHTSMQTKITDLEAKIERLQQQLGKAKSVNDVMWDTIVQQAVEQSNTTEDPGEGERKRKRGKC